MFVSSCFVVALSVVSLPLFLSLSLLPSVYLSPSYVDIDRRLSGLLTLLAAVSLSSFHLCWVKDLRLLKRSLSNLKYLIVARLM